MAKPPNYSVGARRISRMSYVCYKKQKNKHKWKHTTKLMKENSMPLDSFDLENLIDVIYRWPLSAWILKRNSLKTFSAIKFQFYDHDLAKLCYVTYCHGIFWKNCWKKSFSDHTHIKLSKIIDPKIRHCLIQGAKSRLVCKRIIDLTHF